MDLFDLIPRNSPLDSEPPQRRFRFQNRPTLLISWWVTGCSLALIGIRLWGRMIRNNMLFPEDKIMAWSVVPLLIRMAFVDPILLFGTNNTTTAGFTPEDISQRTVGSKLVLAARIFYALFIWMAKWTVSEYLKRLTSSFWTRRYEMTLNFIRSFLVVTFVAVVIATLAECHPFPHYWQVVPDPGPSCRTGYAQLLVMGLCDIVTDVLLVLFPVSIISASSMPLRRKVSINLLFSLSLLLIAITSYRMATVISADGRQQRRTLWASIEILAASAVTNALILGSFLRDRGVKKKKFKGVHLSSGAENESVDLPQNTVVRTMTRKHFGSDSDEDLFKTLQGRFGSVAEPNERIPTPAGVVAPLGDIPLVSPRTTDIEQATGGASEKKRRPSQVSFATPVVPSRRGSRALLRNTTDLMDVGGLLEGDSSGRPSENSSRYSGVTPKPQHDPINNVLAYDFADAGGLLSPTTPTIKAPTADRRFSEYSFGGEPSAGLERVNTDSSTLSPGRADSSANASSSASVEQNLQLDEQYGATIGRAPRADRSKALSREEIEQNIDRNIAMQLLAKIKQARHIPESPAQRSTAPVDDLGQELSLSDVGGLLGGGGQDNRGGTTKT